MDKKFRIFLITMGINEAALDIVGARLVGATAWMNSSNLGGYMEPNKIDGYTFNPSDGKWYGYPPAPDYGVNDWFDPAPAEKQLELSQQQYWRELNNKVEKASPSQGEAGDTFGPSVIEILSKLPAIVDRYSEISPDIYRDLMDYFFPLRSPLKEISGDAFDFDPYTGLPWPGVDPQNTWLPFDLARNWTRPRDPLVLDLDGDGIELTQASNTVLFDHNADGLGTGTQWVKPDDGFLVRDFDGNGTIDSGRELFGDQTVDAAGGRYADGFSALRALDANHDGAIDSQDAAWAELRVWRDANQDGVSQASELSTLAQRGITRISVDTLSTRTTVQPDGSSTTQTVSTPGSDSYTVQVTQADGSTAEVAREVRNVNLGSNPFYREFASNPTVTAGLGRAKPI